MNFSTGIRNILLLLLKLILMFEENCFVSFIDLHWKKLTKSKKAFKHGFYLFFNISTGKKDANPDYSSPSLSVTSILEEITC